MIIFFRQFWLIALMVAMAITILLKPLPTMAQTTPSSSLGEAVSILLQTQNLEQGDKTLFTLPNYPETPFYVAVSYIENFTTLEGQKCQGIGLVYGIWDDPDGHVTITRCEGNALVVLNE